MENGWLISDSEEDYTNEQCDDAIRSIQGSDEPDPNATVSQRVFFAARDGMALTLYALLANQARPEQV